jgi:hypothetical protein
LGIASADVRLSLNHHKQAIDGLGEFNLTITIIGDITYTSTYTDSTSWLAPFSSLKGNTSTLFDGLKEETVRLSIMYGLPAPSFLKFGFHALDAQDEPFATARTWEDRYEASDNDDASDDEDSDIWEEGVSVALIVGTSVGASILVLGCCCYCSYYWYSRQVGMGNSRPTGFPMTGKANDVQEAKRPATSATAAPIDVPSAPSPTIGKSAPQHAVSQPSVRFCTRCENPASPESSFCGECGLPSLAGLEVLQPNYDDEVYV